MRKSDNYVEYNGIESQYVHYCHKTEVCWCSYDRSVVVGSRPGSGRLLARGCPVHLFFFQVVSFLQG